LLTLSGGEQLQAAVSAVQIELVNAEQMLEDLYEAANLASTEAQQSVANARDAVRDADRKVNNLINNTPQVDIDQAFANFILAGDKLEKAQEDFEPYANKPEDNLERAVFQSKLAQAQKEYDDAVRYLNNLEGQANEIDLAQAQADLAFAQALLEKAQADYEKVQDGQVDPDLLESAQARLNNAETQLAAAQAALANLSIEAPFSGTISALYIRENEWVNPGQPVLLLGDLTKLQVETTDLNEIDVARIEVGSIATITFDALPQEIIEGTVVRIAPKASQGSGVNYTVIIELEEIPEGLRWDMTAFVDIEVTE
jgi:multidrug resistance efflux pump